MKSKEAILKGLEEMEIRRKSYSLDMFSRPAPNEVVYNTDIIRKMEVTDATIHTLKWVLGEDVPPVEPSKKPD